MMASKLVKAALVALALSSPSDNTCQALKLKLRRAFQVVNLCNKERYDTLNPVHTLLGNSGIEIQIDAEQKLTTKTVDDIIDLAENNGLDSTHLLIIAHSIAISKENDMSVLVKQLRDEKKRGVEAIQLEQVPLINLSERSEFDAWSDIDATLHGIGIELDADKNITPESEARIRAHAEVEVKYVAGKEVQVSGEDLLERARYLVKQRMATKKEYDSRPSTPRDVLGAIVNKINDFVDFDSPRLDKQEGIELSEAEAPQGSDSHRPTWALPASSLSLSTITKAGEKLSLSALVPSGASIKRRLLPLNGYSKDVQDLIADEELLRKKSQALLNIQVLRHSVLDNPTISRDHDLTKIADALTAIKILKVLDNPDVIKDMLENPNPELKDLLAEEPDLIKRVMEILNSADKREEHRIFAVRILKAFKEECSHLLPPDSKTNSSKSSTPRKGLRSLSSSKIQTAKKGHGQGLTSSMSSSGSGSVSQELAPVESSALSLGDELLSAGAVRIQEDSLREEDSGTHAETVEVFDSSPRARIPRNPSGRDYQVEVTLVSDDNAVSVDGDSDDNAVSVDGDTPRGRLTA